MLVTVQDMARCREERAHRQRQLLQQYGGCVVSLTMNIAGPLKHTPLIEQGFRLACHRVAGRLAFLGYEVQGWQTFCRATGCEMLCVCRSDAKKVKQALYPLEEQDALGRLMDIDVIASDGAKVGREELGLKPRTCLLCGQPAAVCGRSRAHSVEALFARTEDIIREALLHDITGRVANVAQRALMTEACVTPKPGLVDGCNQGAHQDMDILTFAASAAALHGYFAACAREGATLTGDISGLMPRLRLHGLLAEQAMLAATGGVNTHKGAIYGLGILAGAAGHLMQRGEAMDEEMLLALSGRIAAGETAQLAVLSQGEQQTGGIDQYARYGLTGARGQAAAGFPAVKDIALPALKRALAEGLSLNEACVHTLLHLMAKVDDNNVIRRGGMEGQQRLMQRAAMLLQSKPMLSDVRRLDEQLTGEGLSPGGCADLMAFTLFVHWMAGQGETLS